MTDSEPLIRFPSMPNFREVGASNGSNSESEGSTNGFELVQGPPIKLYRSSRPDFLTEEEVCRFKELDIKCIIDFRSASEYRMSAGRKLLDSEYAPYKVKLPIASVYKPGQSVTFVAIKKKAADSLNVEDIPAPSDEAPSEQPIIEEEDSDEPTGEEEEMPTVNWSEPQRKHYFINFFRMKYIWAIYRRAPWYVQIYSLFFLLVDFIFSTGYRYFVRLFATHVLNKQGIAGQYKDMLEHSGGAICAALKLLSEPDNVPAMLNCAHGKDRTGLVSALILSCLGRTKHDVAIDYARSEAELESMRGRLCEEIVDRFHMCPTFTTASYQTMMIILEHIDDTYGSVENYLESIGFSREEQERLRSNLIG